MSDVIMKSLSGQDMKENRLFRALTISTGVMAIAFVIFFALQTIAYRINLFSYLGLNLFILSLCVSFAILFTAPALTASLIEDRYERRLIATLTAVAFLGYANVYNIIFPVSLERSFSVRILVNLLHAPNESLAKHKLEELQPKEKIYDLRYKEMLGSGLIDINGDKIRLTARGEAVAQVYVFIADVMGYSKGFRCVAMEKCSEK